MKQYTLSPRASGESTDHFRFTTESLSSPAAFQIARVVEHPFQEQYQAFQQNFNLDFNTLLDRFVSDSFIIYAPAVNR